jgi:hypothetical protein
MLDLSAGVAVTKIFSISRAMDVSLQSRASEGLLRSIYHELSQAFCLSGIDSNEGSASFSVSANSRVTHVLDLSAGVAVTKIFSVSRAMYVSLQSRASEGLLRLVYLRKSHAFSLSGIEASRFCWHHDLIEVSVTRANSSVLPHPDVLPSLSSLLIQITHHESGWMSSSWMGRSSLHADADGASRGFGSVGVVTGLAVALLFLVMLVSVLIFWFATGRRTATDVTDAAEFAIDGDDSLGPPDPMDHDDYWAENLGLASAVNALGSGTLGADIPFTEPGMMEEGLWMR